MSKPTYLTSTATFTALLSALHRASGGDVRLHGLGDTPWRVYGSTQAHSSLVKAAMMAGLGEDAVRAIDVDPVTQAMDVDALRDAIVEDVEAGLRFLFNAMAAKPAEVGSDADPFQGIPAALYLDNGPVAKSAVFKRVMESLGVEVLPHMPAGSDGRRTTARAKGKVERPFRTVKDAHETLYHFHEPETEAEANRWLARFIATYNRGDHRSEPHSRIDDWQAHLPADGVRQMCAWERFCAFAREPERRLVGLDCRLTVAGVTYEVDAELAGETVVVWWGLFDQELWVEHGEERLGPFRPAGGPTPLHRYRKHRKSRHEVRADQVAALADRLALPRAALSGEDGVVVTGLSERGAGATPMRPFKDPDPFHQLVFANPIAARRAIADAIRVPLATLSEDDRAFIDALLDRSLARPEILAAVRERFPQGRRGGVG